MDVKQWYEPELWKPDRLHFKLQTNDASSQGLQNSINPSFPQIQTCDTPSQGLQNSNNQSASQLQTSDVPSQGENGTNQSTPRLQTSAASVGQQNNIKKEPEHTLHPPEPKPQDIAQGHLDDPWHFNKLGRVQPRRMHYTNNQGTGLAI